MSSIVIVCGTVAVFPQPFFYLKPYIWWHIKKNRKMNEITVTELKQWLDEGKDFQLIDVREPFEYEMSNINGENIPLAGVTIEADKISRDKPVIMQCRSGARSASALQQLEKLGYNNVYNLKGGILAWAAQIDPELRVY